MRNVKREKEKIIIGKEAHTKKREEETTERERDRLKEKQREILLIRIKIFTPHSGNSEDGINISVKIL